MESVIQWPVKINKESFNGGKSFASMETETEGTGNTVIEEMI